MRKEIPIFFTFDDNYVVPAAVAFYSLLIHAKENIFYKMYVLHSDITEENQQLLLDIVARCDNGHLEFRNTNGFLQEEWNKGNFDGHNEEGKTLFTADTIVACFAAHFFPEYGTIIYSDVDVDVDVVFMDDVSELIDVDLNDKYIAGIKDAFMQYLPRELSHLSIDNYEKLKDSYIVGALFVFNLANIRKDAIEEKMLAITRDDTIIKRWPDQDILNIACAEKIAHLSLRYISMSFLVKCVSEGMQSLYTKEELFDSVLRPKILHYAGKKPWNYFTILDLPTTKIIKTDYDNQIKQAKLKYRVYYKIWNKLGSILRRKALIG